MSAAAARGTTDENLGALLALQGRLVEATREWARGLELGPEVAAARHEALRINHQRYAALVPAYRRVAEPLGALGPVPLQFIVDNLLLSDLFKSYDPTWLEERDFRAMTAWLDGVSAHPVEIDLDGVEDLATWRARLRAGGVFLSFSSGTSGRMSFVPRDPLTWKALLTNGASYTDESWRTGAGGETLEFDCLVAGPRSGGMGILDAGAGLARMAARSHFLFDRVLTADAVHDLAPAPGGAGAWGSDTGELEAAYGRAFEFIRSGAAEGRLLLVFGAPFQVKRLCQRIAASAGRIAAAPGSLVVTGGGWKSFRGELLARPDLLRLVEETLAVDAGRCIDAYSTSELNCTFRTCRHGRYHVPPLVEAVVLDEALLGVAGRPGHGALAFLDPFAASYPGFVITGDQGNLAEGRCGCGLAGLFIDGEIQRAEGMEVRGCGGVLESITV